MKTLLLIWSLVIGPCLAGPGFFMNQQGLQISSSPSSDSPPVTSGLIFFAEAGQESYGNGDAVSTITDRSGSGFNATQGTTAAKPIFTTGVINGRSVYRFDGVDDGCGFSGAALSMLNGLNGWSVYAIASTATVATGSRTIWTASTSAGATFLRYALTAHTTTGGYQTSTVRPGSGGSFTRINGAQLLTVNQPYLSTAITDLSVTSMWLYHDNAASPDAVSTATVSGPVESPDSFAANIGIGNTGTAVWSGDIALLLIYNVAHDATTRDSIRNWLVARYGL